MCCSISVNDFFLFCKKMKYMLHSRNSCLKDSESLSKSKHCRMKCKTSSRSREQLKDVLDQSPNFKLLAENLFSLCKNVGTIWNWYFVNKIVLTYLLWEEIVLVIVFEIRGWRRLGICKIFEITRTICSKSERSEQFFVTKCFFNLFLEVSHII